MKLLITLLAVAVGGSVQLHAQAVDPPAAIPASRVVGGSLSFDAKASVGDFTGITDSVMGGFGAAENLASVSGCAAAPVHTLVTGNDHRDRDLNKSMESDKYPEIRFKLDSVAPAATVGDTTQLTLQGDLTLHGVTQQVSLPGALTRLGDTLHIHTDFPVNVKDYKVGGLSKFLGLFKMDEHIVVHVDLLFAPADAPAAPASCSTDGGSTP